MSYTAKRRRVFLRLAENFEKKAMDTHYPSTAAMWVALIDLALWASEPDGDAEAFVRYAKDFKS